MAGLPPAATEESFAAIGQDEAALRPAIERLCRRLSLDVERLTRYAAGSRPVYAAGDLVLKLFPPVATWPRWQMEPEVLAAVQGKLSTPTPQVHAAGEHDGWGYVLMSRLPGIPLDTVWDQVPAAGRDRLAGQLGETLAALHRLPPPPIRDWWPADWGAFVARQRAQAVSEHRAVQTGAAATDCPPARRFLADRHISRPGRCTTVPTSRLGQRRGVFFRMSSIAVHVATSANTRRRRQVRKVWRFVFQGEILEKAARWFEGQRRGICWLHLLQGLLP